MDIKLLQTALKAKGYKISSINGVNGAETKAAVKAFQKDNGLKWVDGIAGPETIGALFPAIVEIKPNAGTLGARAVQYAMLQNGVREATGKNDGAEVERFLASVGLGKGYSWCMAFVYWCVEQAAKDLKVKNPLVRTGGVLKQWNEVDKSRKTTVPTSNSIFIIDLGRGNGHTGFVTKLAFGFLGTVEGNTNDNGSANGNGVYVRSRRKSTIKGFITL